MFQQMATIDDVLAEQLIPILPYYYYYQNKLNLVSMPANITRDSGFMVFMCHY